MGVIIEMLWPGALVCAAAGIFLWLSNRSSSSSLPGIDDVEYDHDEDDDKEV